jgi:hypothetical protein
MGLGGRVNPEKRRDKSSFTLVKVNTRTGQELIDGQQTVISEEKARWLHHKLIQEVSETERSSGWTWEIRPNSQTARNRLASGFQPGRN